MAFTTVTDHTDSAASHLNQFASYFNGSASYGSQPLQLITLNDAVNYVLLLKQLDTTNGRVMHLLKADGTELFAVTKDGVRINPDGSVGSAGQVPATISGIETFTGAKAFSAAATFNSTATVAGLATLTGGAALGSRLTLKRATSTASAGSLTLPTDGNLVPISGTTTIASIAAVTGGFVVLEFASASCKVSKGSTLRLDGDFVSAAVGACLLLECDGTNWNEVGRAGAALQSARCPAAGQTLVNNTTTAMTLGTATYDPYAFKSSNTLIAKVAGIYRISGSAAIGPDSAGSRSVTLYKNGSSYAQVAHTRSSSGTFDYGASWCVDDRFSANDAIDVRLFQDSGSSLTVRTDGSLALTFLAN